MPDKGSTEQARSKREHDRERSAVKARFHRQGLRSQWRTKAASSPGPFTGYSIRPGKRQHRGGEFPTCAASVGKLETCPTVFEALFLFVHQAKEFQGGRVNR